MRSQFGAMYRVVSCLFRWALDRNGQCRARISPQHCWLGVRGLRQQLSELVMSGHHVTNLSDTNLSDSMYLVYMHVQAGSHSRLKNICSFLSWTSSVKCHSEPECDEKGKCRQRPMPTDHVHPTYGIPINNPVALKTGKIDSPYLREVLHASPSLAYITVLLRSESC
jgi:hypothetical protein